MDLLVVMDRFEECEPDADTSIGLMAAALERGHRVGCCTAADLSLTAGQVRARVRPVVVVSDATVMAGPYGAEPVGIDVVDAVLVRTDPPVDADYLAMTLLLEFARDATVIVNDPRDLREANEKLYACRSPHWYLRHW